VKDSKSRQEKIERRNRERSSKTIKTEAMQKGFIENFNFCTRTNCSESGKRVRSKCKELIS
jgi:hypothetical protein